MTSSTGTRRGGTRLGQAVRAADPGSFAFVMATGIVATALRLSGQAAAAAWLIGLAADGFAVLVVVSCWRVARYPARLRADLSTPSRAFSSYAFVAACGVLASGLAASRLLVPAGCSKIFSSLVSIDERPRAGHPRTTVTMVVLGDDVAEYLAPGEEFVLVRGCDIGRGVVTRRIFV